MTSKSKQNLVMKVESWKVLNKDVKRQIVKELTPAIYKAFKSYYTDAMDVGEDTEDFFISFMEELHDSWTQEDIDIETGLIAQSVPKLEKYLRTFIISHVMTIASINYGQTPPSLDVEVPPISDYIYDIMCDVAEQAQANPDLFNPNGSAREVKSRQLKAILVIKEAVMTVTADMLPTDRMIDDYVQDILAGSDDDSESSESEAENEAEEDDGRFTITADDLEHQNEQTEDIDDEDTEPGTQETKQVVISKQNWEARQTPSDLMDGVDDVNLDE